MTPLFLSTTQVGYSFSAELIFYTGWWFLKEQLFLLMGETTHIGHTTMELDYLEEEKIVSPPVNSYFKTEKGFNDLVNSN